MRDRSAGPPPLPNLAPSRLMKETMRPVATFRTSLHSPVGSREKMGVCLGSGLWICPVSYRFP